MSEDGLSNGNFRFAVSVVALVVIALGILYGLGEAWQATFTDQRLKFTLVLIAIVAEVATVHYIVTIIRHPVEVKLKSAESHSFGLHSCNADPSHCFKIRGKPLPLCARHTGLYSALFFLAVGALLLPSSVVWFTYLLPWTVHLALFLTLTVLVTVEGGLGKAQIIRQSNWIRFIGGIGSAFAWAFFVMFLVSFFGLFLGL